MYKRTRYKIQDILLTNHGAHKELNNHNIYNMHNWINLNTHNMKTIDRINIHIKQTQHDILKETIINKNKTRNMFYVAGDGATPLIISASLSSFNESSNFETSKFKQCTSFMFDHNIPLRGRSGLIKLV